MVFNGECINNIRNELKNYDLDLTNFVDMFGNCFFHKGLYSGDDNIYFFGAKGSDGYTAGNIIQKCLSD